MLRVKDILKTKRNKGVVLHVEHDDAITVVIDIMVKNDVGSCAVFKDKHFLGMTTFREVLVAIESHGFDKVQSIKCESLVEQHRHCATPEDTIDQIRNIMTANHIRYLPVIDEAHKLTNVISFYDVAKCAAKAVDFENKMLKEYIGDWPDNFKQD